MVNVGRMVATSIGRDIELVDLSLQAILSSLRFAETEGMDAYRRHSLLFNNLPKMDGLGVMAVLDAEGRLVTSTQSTLPRELEADGRDYFLAHKVSDSAGLFVSKPFVSQVARSWSIAVSRRIANEDGSFGGVVVGMLRIAYLESLFRQLDLRAKGAVALLRSDGTVMARHPPIHGLVSTAVPRFDYFSERYLVMGSGFYETRSPSDGVLRLYAYTPVAGLPLVVMVGMAKDDIYEAWRGKAWAIGLVTLTLSAGTLGLTLLLRRELGLRLAAERSEMRSKARYRVLAENSADIIILARANGVVSYISPAIRDVLGWAQTEIEGRSLHEFVHPDHVPLFADESAWPSVLTFPAYHHGGDWIWLEASVKPLPPEMGEERYILNIRDVSRHKEAEAALAAENAQLQAMAATDSLTNLANRRSFDETLEREWKRARREQTTLALLLIDADNFKALNDHYGHQHGDQYLRNIARVIQRSIRRPADFAARYGGEEFAVLLPVTTIDGAYVVAENIRKAVLKEAYPHRLGEQGVMTVSIGVEALVPEENLAEAFLVNRADAALYEAKSQGRNRTCVYTPAIGAGQPYPV